MRDGDWNKQSRAAALTLINRCQLSLAMSQTEPQSEPLGQYRLGAEFGGGEAAVDAAYSKVIRPPGPPKSR